MNMFQGNVEQATERERAATEAANAEYLQELAHMRGDLRQLREKMMSRTVQRMNARFGRPMACLRARPQDYPELDESKQIWEMQLAQMLAHQLLDPASLLPVDSNTLHDRLLRGPAGEKYMRLLSMVGLPGPEALLVKLSHHQCLEALSLEVADVPRLYISNMDRTRTSVFTQVEDPMARMPGPPPGMMPGMANPMMMGGMAQPPPQGPGPGGIMAPMMMGGGPGGMMPGPPGNAFMPRPPPLGGPGAGMMQQPAGVPGPPGPQPLPPPPGRGTPPNAGGMQMPGVIGGPDLDMSNMMGGSVVLQGGPNEGKEKLEGGGRKRGREVELEGGSDLEMLLNYKSASLGGGHMAKGGTDQLLDVLAKPSAREKATLQYFKSEGPAIKEHCQHLTREECLKKGSGLPCFKLHFRRIIHPWTDERLGNCSYLNTCRNIRNCKNIHYELDPDDVEPTNPMIGMLLPGMAPSKGQPVPKYLQALPEPQWLQCDIRTLDMPVLGKFGVIMADPPWQIHQDLPYGTMEDDEMRNMNIGCLQDHGVIFLWVTGRAMELARECLTIWGYDRVDELIWVKTNQLQRLIRTGRTGHWLNHSKEHCLIGVKGKPALNRYVDCDVLVSQVRDTSRKPDEMYPLLERLSPGTRKLEIFARPHNLKPGWVGLGNQLDGVQILEPEMRARYEARYGRAGPDGRLPSNI